MNASRTAQPRTSPVAFRANSEGSVNSSALPAALSIPLLLSAGQHEPFDLLAALEIDDGPEQLPLFVRAPWIDGKRFADPRVPARLMDVAVERQGRLVLLERLADGGRTERHRPPSRVLEPHVLGQLRRLVEP